MSLQQIEKELNEMFYEREDEIRVILLALLTQSNIVMLGEPGVGKSALAKEVCNRIDGANYFQRLMRRDTVTDELFGPVSLSGLKNDQYKRNTTGKIPEAHIAFIDEVFKSNSTVLNGLLNIMNEKIYEDDTKIVDAPLLTLIGASNELPMEDDLSAVWDRFLFRLDVKDISDHMNFKSYLNDKVNRKNSPRTTISIIDLMDEIEQAKTVMLSEEIVDQLVELRAKLITKGMRLSARRFSFFIDVLRAEAHLDQRTEVTKDDFLSLENCLWMTPEQIPQVKEIVKSFVSDEYTSYIDMFDELVRDSSEATAEGSNNKKIEVYAKISKIMPKIKKAKKTASGKLLNLLKKIEEKAKMVRSEYSGILSDMMGNDDEDDDK